jgi:hypothetical protein
MESLSNLFTRHKAQMHRQLFMTILEELSRMPDIEINRALIAELDANMAEIDLRRNKTWPTWLHTGSPVYDLFTYKGIAMGIGLSEHGYVKLQFPGIKKKHYRFDGIYNWETHKFAPKTATVSWYDSQAHTAAESNENIKALYDELVKAHVRYIKKLDSTKNFNKKKEKEAADRLKLIAEGKRVEYDNGEPLD